MIDLGHLNCITYLWYIWYPSIIFKVMIEHVLLNFHVLCFCFQLNQNGDSRGFLHISSLPFIFSLDPSLELDLMHKNVYGGIVSWICWILMSKTKVKMQGLCKPVQHISMVYPCNVTDIWQSLTVLIYCLTLSSSFIWICHYPCESLQQSTI